MTLIDEEGILKKWKSEPPEFYWWFNTKAVSMLKIVSGIVRQEYYLSKLLSNPKNRLKFFIEYINLSSD